MQFILTTRKWAFLAGKGYFGQLEPARTWGRLPWVRRPGTGAPPGCRGRIFGVGSSPQLSSCWTAGGSRPLAGWSTSAPGAARGGSRRQFVRRYIFFVFFKPLFDFFMGKGVNNLKLLTWLLTGKFPLCIFNGGSHISSQMLCKAC